MKLTLDVRFIKYEVCASYNENIIPRQIKVPESQADKQRDTQTNQKHFTCNVPLLETYKQHSLTTLNSGSLKSTTYKIIEIYTILYKLKRKNIKPLSIIISNFHQNIPSTMLLCITWVNCKCRSVTLPLRSFTWNDPVLTWSCRGSVLGEWGHLLSSSIGRSNGYHGMIWVIDFCSDVTSDLEIFKRHN